MTYPALKYSPLSRGISACMARNGYVSLSSCIIHEQPKNRDWHKKVEMQEKEKNRRTFIWFHLTNAVYKKRALKAARVKKASVITSADMQICVRLKPLIGSSVALSHSLCRRCLWISFLYRHVEQRKKISFSSFWFRGLNSSPTSERSPKCIRIKTVNS